MENRSRPRIGRAVFLYQVEASQRNIQPGLLRKLKHHELDRHRILNNLLKPEIAGDTVLHMDNIIPNSEIPEVGDEGRRLGLLSDRASRHIGLIREVVGAKEDEVRVWKADAVGDGRADDDRRSQVAGEIAGLVVNVFATGVLGATAEPIWQAVLAEQVGEAFDLALVGDSEQHVHGLLHERL